MRFETLEAFQEEFRRNISNGGIFVATEEVYEIRELVDVEIELAFSGESVLLTGDVVHCIPPELRSAGVTPGVALQFLEPAQKLRRRLGGVADLPTSPSVAGEGTTKERRRARRRPARVDAEIRGARGKIVGRTRDLSRTGALIEIDGEPPEVGESVELTLTEPGGSRKLELRGSVVRQADSEPGTVGVEFESEAPPTDSSQASFIERAQSATHTRGLGAIRGPVQPLGIATLLQMFASSAERGSLSLRLPSLQGRIVFEQGALVRITAGSVTGVKALTRLLAHGEGEFQFVPEIEPNLERDEPVAVTQVLMEAVWQVDELKRLDLSPFPPEARLKVNRNALASAGDLEPSDRALLDAIGSGGTRVGALLDAVEDFDLEIYAALTRLRDRKLIRMLS